MTSLTYRHGRGYVASRGGSLAFSSPQLPDWRAALAVVHVAPERFRRLSHLRRAFPKRDFDLELTDRGWSLVVLRWDARDHEAVALRSGLRRTLLDAVRAVIRLRNEELVHEALAGGSR